MFNWEKNKIYYYSDITPSEIYSLLSSFNHMYNCLIESENWIIWILKSIRNISFFFAGKIASFTLTGRY